MRVGMTLRDILSQVVLMLLNSLKDVIQFKPAEERKAYRRVGLQCGLLTYQLGYRLPLDAVSVVLWCVVCIS